MSNAHFLLAVAALATAAGAHPSAGQPMPMPMPMPTRDFVKAAADSDQYEILAGRVALVEGQGPGVRAFAREMIQDHTQTRETLEQAAVRSGMTPPPPGLGEDGQKMLSQLQSLKGADFDRAYATQQVLAHQQALVVEQGYAAGGSDQTVRHAAQSAVPIIQRHLEMARRLGALP